MVLSFTDHFWGEKNNGFDILYHNMKHGQLSSKEFSEFLKESCNVEESYAKALGRLAKYAGNCGAHGSFSPYWQVLKSLAERLSTLHVQIVHSWQDLMKDVHRYTDEQHKKHKSIKETESGTLETVHCIQQTIVQLHKAKETANARCLEYERLKRENASPKDVDKAETKYKKANDDYKALVEKYANVRNDFETKMNESCKKFQEVEENHLQQMRDFVDTYAKAWENQHNLIGQVHAEVRQQSESLTVQNLLETFIHNKTTGTVKPGPIEYEETDLSSLPPPSTPTDNKEKEGTPTEKPKREDAPTRPFSLPAGFLRKKGDKNKEKKKKKKGKDKEEDANSEQNVPAVDEEGYSIRPENPQKHVGMNSWYSSSDSDSDTEEKRRKLKVEIKPLNSPSDSTSTGTLDDIKNIVGVLRISPNSSRRQTPVNDKMPRSVSVTDNMNSGKPNQDLLGFDIFGGSSASTPTGATSIYDIPPYRNSTGGSAATTPISPLGALGSNGTDHVPPSKQRSQTPTLFPRSQTPTLFPGPPSKSSIAGPPIRQNSRSKLPAQATARPGRTSPGFGSERTDSPANHSSTFSTSSMPIGSSRGPSPLTLGMSDAVPLAAAFSETTNAIFKGSDTNGCLLKMTGDMMLSFPAGIVRALMDNPNPNVLTFRIKNSPRLEQVLVNKQLVSQDTGQSDSDSLMYSFDMSSLSELLRRQAEQNRTASHFNIDILKYQIKCQAGNQSAPLHLQTYWKCDAAQTDFRLDYQYNSSALASPQPLTNVSIFVPVDGQVTNMQSIPTATWVAENNRAIWKPGDISEMKEDGGRGSLRAKFELSAGPSKPSSIAAQFLCEGTTMSGIEFELVGTGYRTSLIKRRFVSGKYICDAES